MLRGNLVVTCQGCGRKETVDFHTDVIDWHCEPCKEVLRLKDYNKELEEDIDYLLKHLEKLKELSEIPEGLSSEFYRTLSYSGDLVIQKNLVEIWKKHRKAYEV